ncbi:hypothetical protein FQV26_13515 [Planococcus sp. CPCC 101016]|uniref:hypothetical protein n=1 Tax=Planococcus sp. CPCC 101016 TaxID=2599617 RepID=UPI0011B605FA|nr:hypothetical protein [Planococcus sp. CPCC 101016]TWT05446.1 hypothetical protein FQV26_13515 [Planococcus sp. CPCC 101016]
MNKKRYLYIFVNIFVMLTLVWNWKEIHDINKDIKTLVINVGIIIIIINILLFFLDILYNKFFVWYEKKSREKYNFYQWIGNPDPPINMYEEFKNKKDFSPKDFNENCRLIKTKVKEEMASLNKLKSYKTFLELQINSPRLNAVMNSFQTILIAIITATLITFLNFFDVESKILVISYFVSIILAVGLFKGIDFFSNEIDRNRLLLILVNECIEEFDS